MAGLGPAIHADRHTDAHLRSWMPRPSPGMTLMGSDALILPRRHCDPGLNPGEAIQEQTHDYCRCATRSILEGAKALVRANRRAISNPNQQSLAVALSQLEEEIASFDAQQRHVALTALGGPKQIRGLAG